MRLLLPILVVAALAGCFNPQVENGGFVCDPSQAPSCPSGFECVNGRCSNSHGVGGATGSGGGGGGGTLPTGDMSDDSPTSDLSLPPGDLAHGGSADLSTSGSCAHSLCTTGVKLTSGCDPCVTQICGQDSYCCVTKWSSQCVTEVTSICGGSCP